MGKDQARGIKGGSIWGCNNNPAYSCSWYSRYAELTAHILSHIRTRKDLFIAGLDPAPKGLTGFTLLEIRNSRIHRCSTRVAPLSNILKNIRNSIIGIDAPLYTPYTGFRSVEKIILQFYRGAKLLPGSLRGMKQLTKLGHSLFYHFMEAGFVVFETHPGSIIKHMNLQLTGRDHAIDSIIASAAAYCALRGDSYYFIGVDGLIVLPNEDCRDAILEIIERCL